MASLRPGGLRGKLGLGGIAAFVVLVGGLVAYFATRSSDQSQLSADVLPVLAGTHRSAVFLDCSKINSITYASQNPCQTFVLLESLRFPSAAGFLEAERRRLRLAGWRPGAPQPVDYDGVPAAGDMASSSESWVSPRGRACAYVVADRAGVAAEAKGLFPYDPYNQPGGVLSFYRKANAAEPSPALWVRLRSPNMGGTCVS